MLGINLSLGSGLVPSYLTKIHVILEDRQSILALLPTVCGYTLRVSHTKKQGNLRELEKAVEITLVCGWYSHSISHSPKLPLVFLSLDRNIVHVFYFLIKIKEPLHKLNC